MKRYILLSAISLSLLPGLAQAGWQPPIARVNPSFLFKLGGAAAAGALVKNKKAQAEEEEAARARAAAERAAAEAATQQALENEKNALAAGLAATDRAAMANFEKFRRDALKAEAQALRDKTLVFKDFRLGMDITDATLLLNHYLGLPRGSMSVAESSSSFYRVMSAGDGSVVGGDGFGAVFAADADGRVYHISFDEGILSALFSVDFETQSYDTFLRVFQKSYGLGDFGSTVQDIVLNGEAIGSAACEVHEDPKGFVAMFYTDDPILKNPSGLSSFAMQGCEIYGKNTLVIKATASDADLQKAFD